MNKDDIFVWILFLSIVGFFVAVGGPIVIKDWHDAFVHIGSCK